MAGVFKRQSDKARGKAGKWTAWWVGADGKQRQKAAFVDRAASLNYARQMEAEARLVREGLADPSEKGRREAAQKPVAAHVEDYRLDLLAKGGTAKHADRTAGSIARLLADAVITSVADLAPDRIQAALGRLRQRRSPRTCNHDLAAVKAFARWLELSNRIKEAPKGLMKLRPYNEKLDRKVVRRALTRAELDRLLEAASAAAPVRLSRRDAPLVEITGPERAALYRLAMGTGFRANELRSLVPESFRLDGPEPTVTVLAAYAKNRREAVQPITRELAEALKPFVAGKEPGQPVLRVPEKTAKLLRRDLELAGIPFRDESGAIVDFHALRTSFITHLINSGANPKVVQSLARHSTVVLTLDRYAVLGKQDTREALEKLAKTDERSDPDA